MPRIISTYISKLVFNKSKRSSRKKREIVSCCCYEALVLLPRAAGEGGRFSSLPPQFRILDLTEQ